ncbi:MAG: serine hydrolase [Clostridium sp.]
MRKNLFVTAIFLILFIALNILLPPHKPIVSSTDLPNTKEIITVENPVPITEPLYEDIAAFNPSSYNFPKLNAATEATESFDEELYLELMDLLGENINNVGLVYYNFSTKKYVNINENMDFDAASTYKVGLNLLYYYYAAEGEIDLSEPLTYYDYFYEDGTGILSGYCYSGMEIPIANLLDLSIIYSDNIATAMLSYNLGGYNAVREQLYSLLNINYTLYENLLTPAISAEILKYVYFNQDIPGFSHLISTMRTTIFHDRLDRDIPHYLVAHKIGSIDSYVHDIGIVFTDDPYLISIYTVDLYNSDDIIASLSKIIYNKNTSTIQYFKKNETSTLSIN